MTTWAGSGSRSPSRLARPDPPAAVELDPSTTTPSRPDSSRLPGSGADSCCGRTAPPTEAGRGDRPVPSVPQPDRDANSELAAHPAGHRLHHRHPGPVAAAPGGAPLPTGTGRSLPWLPGGTSPGASRSIDMLITAGYSRSSATGRMRLFAPVVPNGLCPADTGSSPMSQRMGPRRRLVDEIEPGRAVNSCLLQSASTSR